MTERNQHVDAVTSRIAEMQRGALVRAQGQLRAAPGRTAELVALFTEDKVEVLIEGSPDPQMLMDVFGRIAVGVSRALEIETSHLRAMFDDAISAEWQRTANEQENEQYGKR